MTLEKCALQLLPLLSSGVPRLATELLAQLNISHHLLQQALGILQSWGLLLLIDSKQRHRLIVPPRLCHATLCHYSQHSAIQLFPLLPSTNQYLLDHYQTLPSGAACVAEYQTLGRGRRGRQWLASFGSCALFSMLWHWSKVPQGLSAISLALSLVAADTLQQLGVEEVKVKWPNDLYLQGRKLGGVLIETSGSVANNGQISLIIGIGLNLYPSCQRLSIKQPVISLQEAAVRLDGNQLIGSILNAWRTALQQFSQQGLAPFLNRWPSYDLLMGKWLQLQTPGGSILAGIARGIDPQGALLVEHQGKLERFPGGTVRAYG
ncbi:MAG: biotin--[acetyl-CoA-carboxylase] ligase [Candidatus Symbiodolus clandestinus]